MQELKSENMLENRRFSEMRRDCVNGSKMLELHAKCVPVYGQDKTLVDKVINHLLF